MRPWARGYGLGLLLAEVDCKTFIDFSNASSGSSSLSVSVPQKGKGDGNTSFLLHFVCLV